MRHLGRFLAGGVLVAALAVGAGSTRPQSTEAFPGPQYISGWIPYWLTDWQRPFDLARGNLQEISPMAFEVDDVTATADPLDVVIEQTESTSELNAIVAKAGDLPVIPAVFDSTANNVLAQVLADPARRAAHIQQLMTIVNDARFDGIDLDYENFAFNDSAESKASVFVNWPIFLTDLKAAMQPTGKILSVTVPPVWTKTTINDTTKSPATCSFDNVLTPDSCRGYRMYNWPATIGAGVVDRFRIMIYDWSVGRAGPIAPVWWYDDVVALIRTRIAPGYWGRIQLGVPSYGRSWATTLTGTCPDGALTTRSVQMEEARSLAASKGVTPEQDPASRETTFTWVETATGTVTTPPISQPPPVGLGTITPAGPDGLQPAARLKMATCTLRRTVFVPDEWTLAERAIKAREAGMDGIVMWAFGYDTRELWPLLASPSVTGG